MERLPLSLCTPWSHPRVPILSIQQPNEAGIFTRPLPVWKQGLREGVDGRLVPGHRGPGLPTFPVMASPVPERQELCSSTQPGLCPPSQWSYRHGKVLRWVVLLWPSLAVLAGQYYFWPIYIFPYVSEGGRIAPIKFYVSCRRGVSAQLTYQRGRELGLSACPQSSQSHLPPPCTTPSPDTVSLRWGRHASSHTFLLKTPQPTNSNWRAVDGNYRNISNTEFSVNSIFSWQKPRHLKSGLAFHP